MLRTIININNFLDVVKVLGPIINFIILMLPVFLNSIIGITKKLLILILILIIVRNIEAT